MELGLDRTDCPTPPPAKILCIRLLVHSFKQRTQDQNLVIFYYMQAVKHATFDKRNGEKIRD